MKTIKTVVYTFDELTDSAKEKARDWFRSGALNYDWWEHIYEDAEQAGLKITSFDLYRNRHAKGGFNCFGGAEQCAGLIADNHGKDCETFKTATGYLACLKKLEAEIEAVDGDDETNCEYETWQDKRGLLADEFLHDILEDYSITLQKEVEYQTSDEVVDETILANGYTFTAEGKRF